VGYEQVYRNGVLLSRGNDYTATDGTTVTLTDATVTGDIIEIFANELVPLADAISKGQFTAKGSLLSASAASTPGVLAVGSNDQVLTADSSTATGLKWATPAAGGMTLLSTTSLSGATTTISGISANYTNLYLYIYGVTNATSDGVLRIAPNGSTNITYQLREASGSLNAVTAGYLFFNYSGSAIARTNANNAFSLLINNYADTSNYKTFTSSGIYYWTANGDYYPSMVLGGIATSSAISSLVISNNGGNLSTGTALLYGVK